MLEWVEEISNKIKLQNNCMKLLILDKCSSHLKTSVVEKIKSAIFFEFIPAGCTSLAQPLDIMVNEPFKDRLSDLFEKWINEVGRKDDNKTKKGYLKTLSSLTILRWIKEAWESIDTEIIIRSFKLAGLFSCKKTCSHFDKFK